MLKRLVLVVFLLFPSMNAGALEYTDVYYNPAEPGWGVFLVQSDTTQFLAFFIYGPDNKPTWYTAQLTEDANGNYNGGLFATTGTYFANPWQGVALTTVGTASFQPTDAYHATLTYSLMGGPTIVKMVERQTLTPYQLAGDYSGSIAGSITGCANPADNVAKFGGRYLLTVTQTGDTASALTFTFVDNVNSGLVCTASGPLVHFGRLYRLANGQLSCSGQGADPTPAPATINTYHPTAMGIEGRLTSTGTDGCTRALRFAAVRINIDN